MTTLYHPDLLLQPPERLSLALAPTPLHRLSQLSELLETNIYCKRDDLTGFGFGGNKIRKLEYLLSDARRRGCDCLVTNGSNQSNWCRTVAAAGASLGMDVHLVLAGPVPNADTGNLRLSRLAGAHMTHIDTEDDAVLEAACNELAESLRASGRHPYQMIVGGSTGLGSLGYVHSLQEIMEYEQRTQLRFSRIIHATGSAGTQAGLVAGAALLGWPGEVIGMAVSRAKEEQIPKVRRVLEQMLNPAALARAKIVVEDAYVGAGYRKNTPQCLEAVELFARTEGIYLDEVYTGKAAAGLIDYARTKRFSPTENILFIHTGGSPQLFE
ncbi:D-cysteine desulfhydrase family protein [Peristeroidobacter soli]|uniref:D-cysteine desulfhydrase family protein n=1 Tax=Peristeroidobacter soli TaxID=2497877 RepID=UPI00101C023F|nr:D-cysteine desulfhydrase family protein [Peristeroidobacter soli]